MWSWSAETTVVKYALNGTLNRLIAIRNLGEVFLPKTRTLVSFGRGVKVKIIKGLLFDAVCVNVGLPVVTPKSEYSVKVW